MNLNLQSTVNIDHLFMKEICLKMIKLDPVS
jgi:hypothetical protein